MGIIQLSCIAANKKATRTMLRKTLFASYVASALCACDSSSSSCEEGKLYDEARSPSRLVEIVNTYLGAHDVTCYDSKEITVEGEGASLFAIEYGAERDCPSGCFSSVLCAINDVSGPVVYYAKWQSGDELPSGISGLCEHSPEAAGNTIDNCVNPMNGFDHPITTTSQFANLLSGESLFRHCRNEFSVE